MEDDQRQRKFMRDCKLYREYQCTPGLPKYEEEWRDVGESDEDLDSRQQLAGRKEHLKEKRGASASKPMQRVALRVFSQINDMCSRPRRARPDTVLTNSPDSALARASTHTINTPRTERRPHVRLERDATGVPRS